MNRIGRRAYVAFIAASLLAGGVWAGVGLSRDAQPIASNTPSVAAPEALAAIAGLDAPGRDPMQPPDLSKLKTQLPPGQFLVGAGAASLAPDPAKVQWDTDKTPCVKEDQSLIDPGASDLAGAALAGHLPPGWPKSANCVYLGGYGLGPSRPAKGVDPYAGVNVRSIAISNGKDIVVWQTFDMAGLFSRYRSDLCDPGCGMLDIREAISSATYEKVPTENVAVNATHTHGGADGYGAWGGIPDWYRAQIRDQALKSAFAALSDLTPATIALGAIDARAFNSERRDTYYSAADYGAVWLQARALPARKPIGNERVAEPVIATLVNFAAHPTVLGDENLLMHSDWTGTAAKELGDAFGGAGIVVQGALGNVSPSTPRGPTKDFTGDGKTDGSDSAVQMARDFTSFIGADIARGGRVMTSNRIVAKRTTVRHPISNWMEAVGGLASLLDREFAPASKGADGPSTYRWDKSAGAPPGRGCATAGPITIKSDVSGFRVGDLTVLTAPGELFGTMAEVVKSKARASSWAIAPDGSVVPSGETMLFGQTQDSLGYILQHFEADPGGGVTSNTDPALGEYEEEFMIDRCFGDHVLQAELDLVRQLA
ncbi:MAG: hypothetical protein QOF21_3096 [Actinomycetota bacterium]